jgi:hypothetical protein
MDFCERYGLVARWVHRENCARACRSNQEEGRPLAFAPLAFTPLALTPLAFTPLAFTPPAFTPIAFTPIAFTPIAFAPIAFTHLAFTPIAFTPLAFTPIAFTPLFTGGSLPFQDDEEGRALAASVGATVEELNAEAVT